GEVLRAAATVLRERDAKLALLVTREMGKPLAEALAEVHKCATGLEFYADHAPDFLGEEIYQTSADRSWVSYEPVGVVLAVMPWNFPLWQVFRFATPALMAGNAALLKHSPDTTGAALACQHILTATELPDGLFTALLVADPQVPAITERLIAACGGYFCFRWVRQSPIAARRRRCWAAAAYTDPIAPAPTTASFTPATLLRGRGRCFVGESATRHGFAWCRLASNSQVRA